ncbi:PhzF family phenazine biosynthesis protein [Fulvivirga sedimenti]|uniref:PhzF family phenazine biosynthesis protein n=1 Tax=Fulvivirga sedimenti TaxID=2879465 RepID=A0A9X1HTV6_9BACT|nr:PhzF family phenazine biosynthesis protein [Fulvivirga sedimenti]MCA6075545.1 PhzF family phenazine biosynthesis protein [Fulvivirga sedimenti]MCA6076722.1 PhzF family phenazine biosynthesis protein [Fulvivirga sedimenti]MCA6077850.1 PhzF family phenazine biosynthesis protein [Fulvivirga sedimenti]
MNLPIYQIDAFASEVFQGNPAAVVPLSDWLPDPVLQNIALENNLSETAFFVRNEDGAYHLRWFTPVNEVDLCGHATLATAFVLFEHLNYQQDVIRFDTRSGRLTVAKSATGFQMDFPSDNPNTVPAGEFEAMIGCPILGAYKGVSDMLIEVENQQIVQNVQPDFRAMTAFPVRGFIVTARGEQTDIVSRCFYPAYGVDEDPVTGSAHTTLFSFWGPKLDKTEMTAQQLSARGGMLRGKIQKDRILLEGNAVLYLRGEIRTR